MSQESLNTNEKVDLEGLKPVPFMHRTVTPFSYATVMWSSTIIVQIMVIGLYQMAPIGKLNFLQVMIAGVVSAVIVSIMMALNGEAGMKYGIPFVMQVRAAYGIRGSKVVGFIRSIPAICWNGIAAWIAAEALEVVTNELFGFANVWVYFILVLVLQAVLSWNGVVSIKYFDAIVSYIMIGMLLYFFVTAFATGKVDFTKGMQVAGSWGLPWVAAVMGAIANYTTVLLNIGDLSRHIKPKGGDDRSVRRASIHAQFLGVIPPWMIMFISGIVISLATGARDPIDGLMMLAPNKFFGILVMLFLACAQISSNLTEDIVPPAMAFQECFKTTWRQGVIIVTVLSVITFPWVLFDSEYFFVFQNIYSSFLGPILGVLVADYFVFRRRTLNVEALYDGKAYNYAKGFVPLAVITTIVGAVVSFNFLNYSWLVGFPFSFVFYICLKKFTKVERKYEAEQGIKI